MELTINEIRKKRLEYYNKSPKNFARSLDQNETQLDKIFKREENVYSNYEKNNLTFRNQTDSSRSFSFGYKIPTNNFSHNNNNSRSENDNNNIEGTFESILNNFNEKSMRQNRKQSNFDRSISLDTSKQHSQPKIISSYQNSNNNADIFVTKNKKLDQFKKIVEASYIDHVLNKSDANNTFTNSAYFDMGKEEILSPINNRKNSFFESSLSFTEEISSSNHNNNNNNNNNSSMKKYNNTTENGSVNVPYKIQLMSAYNIYDASVEETKTTKLRPLGNIKTMTVPQGMNKIESTTQLQSDSDYDFNKYYEMPLNKQGGVITLHQLSSRGSSIATTPIENETNDSYSKKLKSPYYNSHFYRYSDDYMHPTSNSSSSTSPGSAKIKQSLMPLSSRLEILKTSQITNQPIHEVKPPSTKRSSQMLTYRKTMAKRQMGATNNTDTLQSSRLDYSTSLVNKNQIDKMRTYSLHASHNRNDIQQSNSSDSKSGSVPSKIQKDENNTTNKIYNKLKSPHQENKRLAEKQPLDEKTNTNTKTFNSLITIAKKQVNNSNPQRESLNATIPDLIKNCVNEKENIIKSPKSRHSSTNEKIDSILQRADELYDSLELVERQKSSKVNNQNNKDLELNENIEDTLDMLSDKDIDSDLDCDDMNALEVKYPTYNQKQLTKQQSDELKINLDELTSDDDSSLHKAYIDVNSSDITKTDDVCMISIGPSIKQTKPSFIPNLMLDFNEDDRSISVAASLAKSMFNGIDYKNEMENLLGNKLQQESGVKENNFLSVNYNYNNHSNALAVTQAQSNKSNEVNLNAINDVNINNDLNVKQIDSNIIYEITTITDQVVPAADPSNQNNDIEQNESTSFLNYKPPIQVISPRNENAKIIKNSNSSNRKLAKNKLHNEQTQNLFLSNSTNDFNSENLRPKNKQKVRVSSANVNTRASKLWESADINSKSNIKLNLFTSNNTKNKYLPKRPSSAAPSIKSTTTKTKTQEPVLNTNQTSSLFFDYSKLHDIETNINNNLDSVQSDNIDNTNNAFIKIGSKTIELKFDLPLLDSVENKQHQETPISTQQILDIETSNKTTLNNVENLINVLNEQKSDDKIINEWCELPHEVWLQVLKHLSSKDLVEFGCVCKIFHVIYTDQTLWRTITVKNKTEVRDEWLHWIGKRQPNELSIIQCTGNVSLLAISEMFRAIGDELISLNLSGCFTGTLSGDNVVLQASIRCPNITHLDLSWTLLSNDSLVLIADSFRIIQSINLSGCNMIKEEGINRLVITHGESLQKFEIFGCFHLSSDCLTNISVYCKNLTQLNIGNCHRMTSEAIMECCQSWTNLKFLDVRGLKSIKNSCVSQIMRKCTNLTNIALANCIHITDTSILEIVTYKPNFKYIDVKGCKKITDFGIIAILNSNVELDYLDISATSVTDQGTCQYECSRTVQDLNLSFLPVSDVPLINLVKSCSRLKNLYIYGCYNIKKHKDLKSCVLHNHLNNPNIHFS